MAVVVVVVATAAGGGREEAAGGPLVVVGDRLLEGAAHHPSFLLRGCVLVGLESVLVHDPVRLPAVGCSAPVEDERLPHADDDGPGPGGGRRRQHRLVPAGGLPEAGGRGAVGPRPAGVLAVLVAEEVPLRRRRRLMRSMMQVDVVGVRRRPNPAAAAVVIITAPLLQIPWLDPVEINLPDDVEMVDPAVGGGHLPGKVVAHQLFLGGVEPEAGGNGGRTRRG